MINVQLSKNLRTLRTALGWSQESIAAEMNLSRQAYAAYETSARSPSNDTLIRLARFFHVTIDQLLTENIVLGKPSQIREDANLNYVGHTEKTEKNPKFLYMSHLEQYMVCLSRDLNHEEFNTVYTLLESLSAQHNPVKGSLNLED